MHRLRVIEWCNARPVDTDQAHLRVDQPIGRRRAQRDVVSSKLLGSGNEVGRVARPDQQPPAARRHLGLQIRGRQGAIAGTVDQLARPDATGQMPVIEAGTIGEEMQRRIDVGAAVTAAGQAADSGQIAVGNAALASQFDRRIARPDRQIRTDAATDVDDPWHGCPPCDILR